MKKILFLCAFITASGAFVSCGNHSETKTNTTTNSTAAAKYECPMKCEPASGKAGKCGKCKMDLVEVK